MKKWRILLVFLFIFSSRSTGAEPNVRIGLSLPLTGTYAEMGNMQKMGFNLWKDNVNRDGGIFGKKVVLSIHDDHGKAGFARKIYRKMIEQDHVDLVFGPYSSGISEAILPITEAHGYPVLLSGASADRLWEKGYKYAFGVYTPASKYAVGFLEMLVKNKIRTIAIVSADDAFSVSLSEHTKKWAEKFSLETVYSKNFRKNSVDLLPVAREMISFDPEAVIVCGHFKESIDMRNALKKLDWFPKAFYASVGPATPKFATIMGEDANLVFSSSQWEASVGIHFPGGKQFLESFKKSFGISPSYHAATSYASGMILQAALEKTGDLDRKKLRNTLSSMDIITLLGRYGVDKSGWQIRHFPLIIQWQAGKKKVVWPEKLKEADPLFR